MPPRKFSRHQFTVGIDDGASQILTDRKPFSFRSFPDNVHHVAREGETLFSLAGYYFRPFDRAAGLWWIIADFQPQPIHDPTLQLAVGTVVIVPSLRTVVEEVFNETRRDEALV